MWVLRRSWSTGKSNNNNREARLDMALNGLEALHHSNKQTGNGIMDAFRDMDSHILTFKSEIEFLKKELKREKTRTFSHRGLGDRVILLYDAETQTETNGEVSSSMKHETDRSGNREAEEENATLKEQLQHKTTQTGDKILPNIGNIVLLSQPDSDRLVNYSTDHHRIYVTEGKHEEVLIDNGMLYQEIRKLASRLNQLEEHILTKEHNKHKIEDIEEQNKNLQDQLRQSATEMNKLANVLDEFNKKSKRDTTANDQEETLSHSNKQYKTRGQKLDLNNTEFVELKKQIQDKESDLTLLRQETNTSLEKIKNKLLQEAANCQLEKGKTKELGDRILQLGQHISDLQQSNEKLSGKYEDAFANTENAMNLSHGTSMTKYLSFHSVLRQPQSDQAVLGILSRLQAEMPDYNLEIIEESRQSKDNLLLVVLYNLSNSLITDAQFALSGVDVAQNIALVVLHSKIVKKASKKILMETDLKKLGIIVDMSFLTAKGIISNELTGDAIQQLAEFIRGF